MLRLSRGDRTGGADTLSTSTMFRRLTELADEVEQDLLLVKLALAAEIEREEEEEERENAGRRTLRNVADRVFTGLQQMKETTPGARPGTGYTIELHLDPQGAPYPRSSLELDQAISRCAAHERGGLLAVGCPATPPDRDRLRALVEARVARRLGEGAIVEIGIQETTEEGPAVLVILRHNPAHRPPDEADSGTVDAAIAQLDDDADVEAYVYRRSPPSLPARKTLIEYGLIVRDAPTGRLKPTLAGQIAFAGQPGVRGLAFLVHTDTWSRTVGGLPLRQLCDEVIEIAQGTDATIDADILRQLLLYAVVHRSWRDPSVPMGLGIDPRHLTLIFPGELHPGWVRNELLLRLVRRNRSLGWRDGVVDGARQLAAGTLGSVSSRFVAQESSLVLVRRVAPRPVPPPARPVATAAPPTAPRPTAPRPPPVPPSPRAAAVPSPLPVVTRYGPDVRAFVGEVFAIEPDGLLDNPVLYERFATWAHHHGADTVPTQRWLAMRMKALGFHQAPSRTQGIRRWMGLRLRT